jgi:hypothetical protein
MRLQITGLFPEIFACVIKFAEQAFQSWQTSPKVLSGTAEFVQFLAVAKGSAAEVVSHLYICI